LFTAASAGATPSFLMKAKRARGSTPYCCAAAMNRGVILRVGERAGRDDLPVLRRGEGPVAEAAAVRRHAEAPHIRRIARARTALPADEAREVAPGRRGEPVRAAAARPVEERHRPRGQPRRVERHLHEHLPRRVEEGLDLALRLLRVRLDAERDVRRATLLPRQIEDVLIALRQIRELRARAEERGCLLRSHLVDERVGIRLHGGVVRDHPLLFGGESLAVRLRLLIGVGGVLERLRVRFDLLDALIALRE
jgi:hypothetical protein